MRPPLTSAPPCTWQRSVPAAILSRCGPSGPSPPTCIAWPTGSSNAGSRRWRWSSTGVYWIPLYEILDQRGFEVVVVNARDAKNVPGRKTDVSDAAWLQRLHEYGLLRASFRPKGEIATLRSYLRQRERLLDQAAAYIQHMQKGPGAMLVTGSLPTLGRADRSSF